MFIINAFVLFFIGGVFGIGFKRIKIFLRDLFRQVTGFDTTCIKNCIDGTTLEGECREEDHKECTRRLKCPHQDNPPRT